jgi:hypothetical protein
MLSHSASEGTRQTQVGRPGVSVPHSSKEFHAREKGKNKGFTPEHAPAKVVRKFTEEMFYGRDIRIGIALSVLAQLRVWRACGYRALFLQQFQQSREGVKLLATLVRELFHIEGKVPVRVQLRASAHASSALLPMEYECRPFLRSTGTWRGRQ